jgi:phage tail sheath protein FI
MTAGLAPGVYVKEVPPIASPIVGASTSTPAFIGAFPNKIQLVARTKAGETGTNKLVDADLSASGASGTVHFVTNWVQFTQLFGDLLGDSNLTASTAANAAVNVNHRNLAQAVYGFFNNGGSGCYVVRVDSSSESDVKTGLAALEPIDDISMVAAPGLTDASIYSDIVAHCAKLQDRVAILDAVETNDKFKTGDFSPLATSPTDTPAGLRPANSDQAAVYFPWLEVVDPGAQLANPSTNGLVAVPPSGHIAGIWARSDADRGVFKAPANEPVLGVPDVEFKVSAGQQGPLNDAGVNIIRPVNGAIRVWGARTIGGSANGNFRYLSTRRYYNYLRKSILQGTQFAVFEPNSPSLWKRIIRSVDAFLLAEWHAGALFGDTPKQAYFVICDATTNIGDPGQVTAEIGVAIVQPTEFVVFQIQQLTSG